MRSSVKPTNASKDNLIDRTIETWQPHLEHDLSREGAQQILENVTGFFSILCEWSRAEVTESADNPAKPVAADKIGGNAGCLR